VSPPQPHVIEGQLVATGLRFGVVVSRFNAFITGRLLEGALDALQRHGADLTGVDVVWVPGTFEVPIVAQQLAASSRYHAVICLGCLIRGGTPHFDYLSAEVTKGVAQVGLNTGVPTVFGVLTTDTIEQAIERAGTKAGNKGFDAGVTAVEMADVMRRLGEHIENAPRISRGKG
jgi:6,7-dimethyl-8-ribityllumazine synthase